MSEELAKPTGPDPSVDEAVAAVKAELDHEPPPQVPSAIAPPPVEVEPPPPAPAAAPQSLVSDQQFVVDKIEGYKGMMGFVLSMRYGLEIDEEVDKFLHLRPNTERLLRANAYWLAPKLRDSVGDGKAEVIIALLSEAWWTFKGLRMIAIKRLERTEPPAVEEPEDDGGEAAARGE